MIMTGLIGEAWTRVKTANDLDAYSVILDRRQHIQPTEPHFNLL